MKAQYEIVFDQGANLGLKCLNGCGQARWSADFKTTDWSTNEDCPNCVLMKSNGDWKTENDLYVKNTQSSANDILATPPSERSQGDNIFLEFHSGKLTAKQLSDFNAEAEAIKTAQAEGIAKHKTNQETDQAALGAADTVEQDIQSATDATPNEQTK